MGNLLLFDRETESLWSQLLSEAVTGPLAGERLRMLPSENTTWGAWKREHPRARVLSFQTGYGWNYKANPYAWLPPPQEFAIIVSAGGETKIYPFSALKLNGCRGQIIDSVGGERVKILYHRDAKSARAEGRDIFWCTGPYSVLKRFYPQAKVYP